MEWGGGINLGDFMVAAAHGFLLSLGWSRSEDLVCVQEDGAVSIYDMFGTYQHTFNMGQEVKDTHIQSAQIFTSHRETGVAILSKSNRIFMVSNIYEPKTRKYPDIPGGVVECWCVVREERHTNVLVSQGRDLLLLNHIEQRPQPLLWIGSSDIRIKYCEYDAKSQVKPKQLA
ncbi:Vacuolar protein sorting-associated protein 16-like 2, partial [Homarus americanus]